MLNYARYSFLGLSFIYDKIRANVNCNICVYIQKYFTHTSLGKSQILVFLKKIVYKAGYKYILINTNLYND